MGKRLYDAEYLQLLSSILAELKERSHFLLNASPGDRIGDIGCGTGEDAWRLAKAGANVVGVDVDEEFIETARKTRDQRGLHLSFEIHDAYSIGHDDHSFDKLRYERIFQHLADPRRAIGEALRLLKPGGQIQIVDADYFSLSLLYPDVHVERMLVDHLVYERLPNAYKVRAIPRYLVDAGFAVTGVEIHPLKITDPRIALKIIKFEEIVAKLTVAGKLDIEQSDILLDYFVAPKLPFNLSINELIVSAQASLM